MKYISARALKSEEAFPLFELPLGEDATKRDLLTCYLRTGGLKKGCGAKFSLW